MDLKTLLAGSSQLNTSPSIYKNIIFDLGAVLIYSQPKRDNRAAFLEEDRIPLEFLEVVSSPQWLELDRGMLTYEELALVVTHVDQQKFNVFLQGILNSLDVLPHAVDLVRQVKAKGYNVFILSNLNQQAHAKISGIEGFFELFDGAIFSYQTKFVKPEPEIYHALLQTYNLVPAECLFIDDREDNIRTGNRLGIDGIVCSDHKYLEQKLKNMAVID